MTSFDIDAAIRAHQHWRRQFLNAFAGGDYADMPLSEHRACMLATGGTEADCAHRRFHALADEIIALSNNGLGDEADLLLPELSEAAHQLVAALDRLR
jgi:hypothetical protein